MLHSDYVTILSFLQSFNACLIILNAAKRKFSTCSFHFKTWQIFFYDKSRRDSRSRGISTRWQWCQVDRYLQMQAICFTSTSTERPFVCRGKKAFEKESFDLLSAAVCFTFNGDNKGRYQRWIHVDRCASWSDFILLSVSVEFDINLISEINHKICYQAVVIDKSHFILSFSWMS